MMTLTDRFNSFMRAVSAERTTCSEQLVYLHLLWIDNSLMFREWFTCSDRRLQQLTGLAKQSITDAKNKLKQHGWIDFRIEPRKTTSYKLTVPYGRADTRADTRALNRRDKNRQDIAAAAAAPAHEKKSAEKSDPEGFAEVTQAFMDNLQPAAGPLALEQLGELFDRYGKAWLLAAISEAAGAGGNSVKYLAAICERWGRDGFRSERRSMHGRGAQRSPGKGKGGSAAEEAARWEHAAEDARERGWAVG